MAKQVSGYQAYDGTFFEDENAAQLHETRKALEQAAHRVRKFHESETLSFETLLLFIEDNANLVSAYCTYYLAKYPEEMTNDKDT